MDYCDKPPYHTLLFNMIENTDYAVNYFETLLIREAL